MKKILVSLLSLGVVVVIAYAGTSAFFSDTETSVGNTFVAGDIDLQIDNESYAIDWNIPGYLNPVGAFVASAHTSWELADLTIEKFFDFVDLKPGDYGEDTISVHVGSNDAWVCAAAQITDDNDNTYTEPEEDDDLTIGADPLLTDGELDEEVNFAFWVDDGDNVYENCEGITDGECIPEEVFLQGPISALGQQGQIALADSLGSILPDNGPIPGDSIFYIGKYWCFGNMTPNPVAQGQNSPLNGTGWTCDGSEVDNAAQTDKLMLDLEFYAEQSRNNPQFSCEDWDPGFVPNLPKVGAVIDEYVTPEGCENPIAATDIQTAVDNANPNDTICVADGTHTGGVTIDLPLTLISENGPSNSTTIDGGVRIASSDVTVSGFKVIPGFFPNTWAAFYLDTDNIGNIVISDNNIDGTGIAQTTVGVETAFNYTYGQITITNNEIHDLVTGIYTNPHTGPDFEITYNDFYDNTAGIGGFTGAHVAYNHFSGSPTEAIGVDTAYDGSSVVEYNNFLSGQMFNTYGGVSGVEAPNNYWADTAVVQINNPADVNYLPEAAGMYPHN